MTITHAAVKSSGDKGTHAEWNADHVIGDDDKPKNFTTLIVAASDSLDTTRADYVCDGIDDQVQINAAMNALPANGGRVSLLEGTYQITAPIVFPDDNVTLQGLGSNTVIQTIANIDMITANVKNQLLVHDIRLVGAPAQAANRGIDFVNTGYSEIVRVYVEDTGSDAIYLGANSEFCIIMENKVNHPRGHGIRVVGAYQTVVSNNTVELAEEDGIEINGVGNSVTTGNIVRECVKHGIRITGEVNFIVANNMIYENDSGETATYDGISVSSSDAGMISGNRCSRNDRYEINISNPACDKCGVVANNCYSTDHVGAINDAGTGTVVASNVV